MIKRIFNSVLLCAAVLCGISCDLPEGPNAGKGAATETGTLTLRLPGKAANSKADVSRSVLSDDFIDGLKYHVTGSGSGGTWNLEANGGETTISLQPGEWTIEVKAYAGDPPVLVGSGSKIVTIEVGKIVSEKIDMDVDPAYKATLEIYYIHNEKELRQIGTDFAINGSIAFCLENDIVLTEPWTPIGSPSAPFKATFDGQEYSITVNSFGDAKTDGSAMYQGFFAYVDGATIRNLTINYALSGPGVDMSTGDIYTYPFGNAGGVAGCAENASFENIQVTGNFSVVFDGD
ncbi:MAG: hypothetical protein LBR99_02810, partial [Treponema sp.]|nr:hypothetical protein [Treponema sp.]